MNNYRLSRFGFFNIIIFLLSILILLTPIIINLVQNPKEFLQIVILFILFIEIYIAISNKSIFKPRFIVMLIFLLNGLIGGANILTRGAFVDFYNELYHLLFYSLFNFGYLLIPNKNFKLDFFTGINLIRYRTKLAYTIVGIGFFAILLNWTIMGGIPIFHGEEFRQNSNAKFSLLFFLGSFASLFLFFLGKKKTLYLMLFLSLFTGFRSTALILISILLFDNIFFSKSSFKKKTFIALLGIIAFLALNMIKFYRDIDYYGMDRFIEIAEKQGASSGKYVLPFLPILNTVIEGPSIFQKIRNNLNNDYGYGRYYFETITTFLPGQQRDYGGIYNTITKAPTENTKTATILSPLYIAGGIPSILIMAFIFGSTLKVLFLKSLFEVNIVYKLFFLNYFVWMVLWMHSGYIFSFTYLVISGMILIFSKNRNYSAKYTFNK